MVAYRPMTEADVPAAVAAFDSGLLAMLARHQLPVTGNSIQDERRRLDRTRHFLGTDPGGSWVAEEGGTVIGMSQSFVREDYWMLSQLGHRARPPGPRRRARAAPPGPLARRPAQPGDDPVLARPQGDGAVHELRVRPPSGGGGVGRHAPGVDGASRRGAAVRARRGDRARAGRDRRRSTARCAGRHAPSTSSPCSPSPGTACCSTRTRATPWPGTSAS